MSIGLIRENKDGKGIDLEIPIATTQFFMDNWNVAADEMDIKIFRENCCFEKNELEQVLEERNFRSDCWRNC